MEQRQLGRHGPWVSTLGFGAFKIGRNEQTKYGTEYPLPDDAEVACLLNWLLDSGVNYLDTAPAYGSSEQRIGHAVGHRRAEYVLSTKVGETFENGVSTYDFSRAAIERSVERSLQQLQTDVLDVVFIHSNADDLAIQHNTDAIATLQRFRAEGLIKQIGLSVKTVAGAQTALDWADVLMVEYHLADRSMESVIATAHQAGIGVVIKKALASGTLPVDTGLRFVLENPGVSSVVVGTLNTQHMLQNLKIAGEIE